MTSLSWEPQGFPKKQPYLTTVEAQEFENVLVTRAGRLQEYALVSDPMVKQ